MKKYIDAFCMAQSMFCALPAPRRWDETARKYMLLFLPLIGLETGILWYAAALLLRCLSVPAPLWAIVLTALPLLLLAGSARAQTDGYKLLLRARMGKIRDGHTYCRNGNYCACNLRHTGLVYSL